MQNGETMALISDAGTPSISDPGFLMVRECLKNNLKVECLPGATAFVPALGKSGFASDKFVFEGFLPHKKGRQTRLKQLADEERTVIFYESPHRLIKTLGQLREHFGDRQASVSRELTKIHEETRNGLLSELERHYTDQGVKGEIVLIVHGKS
jgi:16S rRNA (cytidine1402-2'-O)-methyltransferase